MYEEMYHKLAGAVANAMDLIENKEYQQALLVLEKASKAAEETCISQ